jgi:hypothetical protein
MSVTEMPTSQDAAIVEALGRPLAVLYAGATAGTAEPVVQRVLELRSFLALVEDQAAKIRDRIRHAVDPAGGLYSVSLQDLRFQTALLEAALDVGRTYGQTLQELLAATPTPCPPRHRPAQFTQSRITAVFGPDEALTAQRPVPAGAPREASAGRHRR